MNSKIRALVWEELRVGGPVAAVCLAVGVLLIARLSSFLEFNWLRVEGSVLAIALGMPLLCSLLLVLNVRNSGHLGGGFSRRILRLPVDTGTAVTVAFGVRFAEMLALALLLKLACWLIYRHGPGWDAVLLVAGAYAFIQMLDWMRAVLSWQLTVLFGAVFALVVQHTGLLEWWGYLVDSSTALPPSPLVAVGWIALAFAVSMGLVAWARRGERITLWQRGEAVEPRHIGGATAASAPFASPRAAHFWYHLRRNGLLLAQMTALFWAGGVALYWLVDFYMDMRPGGRPFDGWLTKTKTQFFISQLMPFAALVCAAAGWRLVSGMGERRQGKSQLKWATRLPIPRSEDARTRMVAAGINLAAMLGVVSLVYLVAYLVPNQFTAARLFGAALAHGEASLREIAAALLGPVIVFGLLAWIAMSLPGRLILVYAGTALLAGLLWLGADNLDFLRGDEYFRNALPSGTKSFFVWFVALLPVLMLAADLAVLGWLGWIRRSSTLVCAGLWAGIVLALYPFTWKLPPEAAQLAAVYCAGLAALAVLGWPERVLAAAGGLRGVLHRGNPGQHQRYANRVSGWRLHTVLGMLLVALAGLAWLRLPAPPKLVEALRAQGLPTNLEEADAWYKPVPAPENLAIRYQDIVTLRKELEVAWMKQAADNPALQQGVEETKAKDAFDNVLVQGSAKVKRAEPIPPVVWTTTRDYAAAVTEPVTAMLNEAAQSGLRQSRYPIDLHQGFSVLLPHLAQLRVLARELGVKAWVAAVERHPEDAATAVLDMIPLANSLSEEPLLISQLVRIAIHGIAVENLQTTMNRTELPDATLVRLQDGLKQAVPPLEQGPFLSRAMEGEQFIGLSYRGDSSETEAYDTVHTKHGVRTRKRGADQMLRGVLACMGSDLLGMDRTERMVIARLHQANRDNALEAARTGRLPETDGLFETTLDTMSYHAPMAFVLLPALGRAYESEWRIRTQLNLACTALAVERYRLANGRLPERLEELVPAFLDRVPTDPWNHGKPLSYRVKENGEFVVYSFARNGTDEKGEEVTDANKKNWWREGDMTFTVAPVDARRQPQVADVPAREDPGQDAHASEKAATWPPHST